VGAWDLERERQKTGENHDREWTLHGLLDNAYRLALLPEEGLLAVCSPWIMDGMCKCQSMEDQAYAVVTLGYS